MFSYVDQRIRDELEAAGLLVNLDEDGKPVDGQDRTAAVSILGPVPIPRQVGEQEVLLDWYPFVRRTELGLVLGAAQGVEEGGAEAFRKLIQSSMSVNSVFAFPGFRTLKNPLVRIHSCCLTGDIFASKRCDCGPQLAAAFSLFQQQGGGAVIYMAGHEGRGIGLWAKAITYLLQDRGEDTYQANTSLGLPEDSRDFSDAAVALRYLLGGATLRLLSNNPNKKNQLESRGQPVSEVVPLVSGVTPYNRRYLRSKKRKGHLLPDRL